MNYMRQAALFVSLCFTWLSVHGQRDVVVLEEKAPGVIKLFLLNKTKETKNVSLKVDFSGCSSGESPAMEKVLGPAEKVYAMTLGVKQGTPCMYRTTITINGQSMDGAKPGPLSTEATPMSELVEDRMNIFTKKGCSRCRRVIEQLSARKIPFKEFDTSASNRHNDLMFNMLRQSGFKGGSVTMPVILMEGKVLYDLSDIDKWLESLN
jgi:glutaredoxin